MYNCRENSDYFTSTPSNWLGPPLRNSSFPRRLKTRIIISSFHLKPQKFALFLIVNRWVGKHIYLGEKGEGLLHSTIPSTVAQNKNMSQRAGKWCKARQLLQFLWRVKTSLKTPHPSLTFSSVFQTRARRSVDT